MKLTIACVNVGNYLGRGEEYVRKLRAGVQWHLSIPHDFVVIDQSDKPGWWAKIDLFQPGRFEGRVLYLDLDTVVVGPLEPVVQSVGIVHLKDWGWLKNDYCSAVMVWDAGEHAEAFERFTPEVMREYHGDQDWLTHLGGWMALRKGLNVSYRYESKAAPPVGASTVSFHGRPKPHEVTDGWVPKTWI